MSKHRFYESMFLVDANWAANSFDEVQTVLQELVEKHGGAIQRLERWGDHRLAYPIKIERTIHRRGCYVLAACTMPPEAPATITREVEMDNRMLRTLILHRRPDEIDRIFDDFEDVDLRRRGKTETEEEGGEEGAPAAEGDAAPAAEGDAAPATAEGEAAPVAAAEGDAAAETTTPAGDE